MSDSATIIRDGDDRHRIQITHRDWMLLSGPGFSEGPAFIKAFGTFENFTVAGGIPEGSMVKRGGDVLYAAASALLAGITRDIDLLRHDYSCQIGNEPKQYGGGQGIRVGGRVGILSLLPKGYCSIQFVGRTGTQDVIDLRPMKTFATDSGTLKVHRRKATTQWLEILPPLLSFLAARQDRELTLEHIDRVERPEDVGKGTSRITH
jgi:hypothetical protein